MDRYQRVTHMIRRPGASGRSARNAGRFALPVAASLFVLPSVQAMAANCKDAGALSYIGHFANDSASIWLSRSFLDETRTFRLEAAQQGVYSSTFPIAAGGIHFSFSPSVSNGNGGTH